MIDDNVIKAMGGPVVSKIEFIKFWDEHGKGDPMESYGLLHEKILMRKRDFFGRDLTWELIKNKWISYIKLKEFQETDDQYIMTMQSFLAKESYNNDFVSKLKQKDGYYDKMFNKKKSDEE